MDVSSTQVSRAAAELDELLSAWRDRALGRCRYLVLDARYEKVRQGGQVLDAAVLIACGVDADGRRDVLGCSVSLSEAEVHWRSFLTTLKDRGLYGMELIVKRHLVLRSKTTPTFTHPRSGFRHEAGVLRSVLSRAQRLLKVSEPIASALDVEHMSLVQQSVQDRRGQGLVAGK